MTGDVREFRLPDLGEGLTEAQILTWLVEVGEEIAVDQPVVEVETAKATVEIPSPYAGTVCVRHAESGQAIEVGAPLLSVLTGDGAPDGDGPPERVLVGYGAEPTTRRRRRRLVDPPPAPSAGGERRIVLRGADRTAALRMAQGHREVPTATTWVEADATELLAGSSRGVGYLLKDRVAEVREFVDAVVRVAGGGTALDPEVVAQLLGRSRKQDVLAGLTPREREVLGLMAEGRTNSAIARQLVVSDGAVEKHVSNIFLKLGLSQSDGDHRRVLAVLTYLNS